VYRTALAQLAKDISAYSIVADLSIFESAQFWDSARNNEASTGTRTNRACAVRSGRSKHDRVRLSAPRTARALGGK
jgi:hypothetical protein